MFVSVVERFAAGAIGAIGGDLHRIETAVATVDVMFAGAHVATYGIVTILHFSLLFAYRFKALKILCAKFQKLPLTAGEK